MAFIDKKDPVVLNIKVTSKGRETLSKGHLHFKYYAIGDSEIDYEFLRNAQNTAEGFDPFNSKILRPADKNPDLISFITKNPLTQTDLLEPEFTIESQYVAINEVPSIAWEVENTTNSNGFFIKNGDNFEFKVTEDFVKQPDVMVRYDTISGNTISLRQAPTYGANLNNPVAGDYLLVRWKDVDADFDTHTDYIINKDKPTPILIYKITGVTGSIVTNNLVVTVDRDLPDFSGDIYAGAMILYANTADNIEQQYSTDYASEALISFLENCQCDTILFPFWKLSIIHTENVAGALLENKQFTQHKSAPFAGFVNYIQNHEKVYDRLGVIHYTNVSPANAYAEQFLGRTPMIHIPTIVWHKSTGNTIGATFKATGDLKALVSNNMFIPSLNTKYYNLADELGNVVGKVFVELKIFVIEDQELLFAMSYKSNRSWTLPNFSLGANDSITDCPTCTGNIDFDLESTNLTSFGGSDGTITVNNISGTIGEVSEGNIYLKVVNSGTSQIYYSNNINTQPITISGLTAGFYEITIIDLGAPNSFDNDDCISKKTAEVNLPDIMFGFDPMNPI